MSDESNEKNTTNTKEFPRTLYVTSFAKDMYDASGRKMVKSFKKYNPEHHMVVCYEGFDYEDPNPRILKYDLEYSTYLRKFLEAHKAVIPDYLGGIATKENNPKLFENSWNRLASRWFRKIVAMEYALNNYGENYEYLVWVDADAYFQKHLADSDVDKIFKGTDVVYHLGKRRREKGLGVESGIIGFRRGNGYDYLRRVSNKFRTGYFRLYPRWDDGYIFRMVIQEQGIINNKLPKEKRVSCLDLVAKLSPEEQKRSEVIPYGAFAEFIVHEKGKHKKMNIRV